MMESNYNKNKKARSRSSSPLKKIKRFFKGGSSSSSSHKEPRKDSTTDDIEQMREKSYYHVGSQRIYPPPVEDNSSQRSMISGGPTHFDTHSIQYSLAEHDSASNYDLSEINRNPLYRSDDGEDMEKRYRLRSNESETTSIASGRLLRANEIEDLTRFDAKTGFVTMHLDNNRSLIDMNREAHLQTPREEDRRQLIWPKTVFKRPTTKSTSFRNSDSPIIENRYIGQFYNR